MIKVDIVKLEESPGVNVVKLVFTSNSPDTDADKMDAIGNAIIKGGPGILRRGAYDLGTGAMNIVVCSPPESDVTIDSMSS